MNKAIRHAREAGALYRDAETLVDFVHLMRVRLSQSKIGPWLVPRPISVSVNLKSLGRDVHLRSHTTDISVFKEIVLYGSLGGLQADPSARQVVDLGANTGLSYRWLRRLYPAARITCVEPDPENLAVLRANSQGDPGCVIVPACIGGRERKVGIHSATGEWGYRMVDDPGGTIPVITMGRLLATVERVDVLKCDIEGAEGELFDDCQSWLGRVSTMIVECHLDTIDADGLCATLAANGANFDRLGLEASPEWGLEVITLGRPTPQGAFVAG